MSKVRSNEFINVAGDGAPSFPQGATSIEPTMDNQVATKSYVDNLTSLLGNNVSSLVAPTNPKIGSFWIDTSLTPNALKTWNGNVWVEFSGTMGGLVSTSKITTPEVLTPAHYSGFPVSTFTPRSSEILGAFGVDATTVNIKLSDTTVSDVDGNLIPGLSISDVLTIGEPVYASDYNPNPHWIATLNGVDYEQFDSVAVDSLGNVYAAGHTESFDGEMPNGASGLGIAVGILAKYSSSGDLIWHRTIVSDSTQGNSGYVALKEVTIDSQDNVYVVGQTYDRESMQLYYSDGNPSYSQSNSNYHALIIKFDSDANVLFQRGYTGSNQTSVYAATTDGSDNLYVAGGIAGHINSHTDGFVAKYDSSGVYQWGLHIGKTRHWDRFQGISCDSSGNICLSGETEITADDERNPISATLNQNMYVPYLAKIDSAGTMLWQRIIVPAETSRRHGYSYAVATDSSDNIYITGRSMGYHAYLIKIDSSGDLQWQRKYGNGNEYGHGISVDDSDNIYICGQSQSRDTRIQAFVAKYNSSGVIQWQRHLGYQTSADIFYDMAIKGSNMYLCGYMQYWSNIDGGNRRVGLLTKLPTDGSFSKGITSTSDYTAYGEHGGWTYGDPDHNDVDSGEFSVYDYDPTYFDSIGEYRKGNAWYFASTTDYYGPVIETTQNCTVHDPGFTHNIHLMGSITGVVSSISGDLVNLTNVSGGTWKAGMNLTSSSNAQTGVASPTITMIAHSETGNYRITGTDRSNIFNGDTDPEITVYVGDTLIFNNSGLNGNHPMFIRVADGGPSVSNPAATGEGTSRVTWVPTTPGTYYYQCGSHPAMIGSIAVLPVPSTTFTSSTPTISNGLIATWGNAEWQIAEDSAFTTNLQTLTSPLVATIDPMTFNVTTSSQTGDYLLTGSDRINTFSGDADPEITVYVGDTIVFDNSATYSSHPMYIRPSDGGPSVTNPHASGVGGATVSWTPTVGGTYYYQCGAHAAMIGTITVLGGTQSGPTGFNMQSNNSYYVRVRYDSSDPQLSSDWSPVNYFRSV